MTAAVLLVTCGYCSEMGQVAYRPGQEREAAEAQVRMRPEWTRVGSDVLCPDPECQSAGREWAADATDEG